ncbi:MAG: hypothetical protein JXR05_04605 [Flavobacteriaceae bacterium]
MKKIIALMMISFFMNSYSIFLITVTRFAKPTLDSGSEEITVLGIVLFIVSATLLMISLFLIAAKIKRLRGFENRIYNLEYLKKTQRS